MCERNINWLPQNRPQLGPWPTAQACALTGNQTSDFSIYRPAFYPLTYISQGDMYTIIMIVFSVDFIIFIFLFDSKVIWWRGFF